MFIPRVPYNHLVNPSVRLFARGQLEKMAIALKPLGILCDTGLAYTDRYRQDIANEHAKCELSLTEAKPKQKCENIKI